MDISLAGEIILYTDISIMGILSLLLFGWQVQVLRGKSMDNPDGTKDDWHEQKIYYGMSLADLLIAIPLTLIGIMLIFMNQKLGYYLTGMTSFWYVWVNSVFTITSLRFEKPKITPMWFFVFPLGIIVGLIYLIWSFVYFYLIF